jgi:hypothetical protein
LNSHQSKLQTPQPKSIENLDELKTLFEAPDPPTQKKPLPPPTILDPNKNPELFEDDPRVNYSRRTGGPKKQPRGNTAPPTHRANFYPPNYKPQGRKVWDTLDETLQRENITTWVDGTTFVDDLSEPFPLHHRDPDNDPVECESVIDLLGYWVAESSNLAYPLTLAVTEREAGLPPIEEHQQYRKWSRKRVSLNEYLRFVNEHPGSTIKEIAESIFGPFPSEAVRRHTIAKVRTNLQKLLGSRSVRTERDPNDTTRMVKWHPLVPPNPVEAGRLMNAPAPEPRTGRHRIRIEGETILFCFNEDEQDALGHLARVCAVLGLTVGTAVNDPAQSDYAVERRPQRRQWPHLTRHHSTALDVLRDCRAGVYEALTPDDAPTPMFVTLGYWARMLYRPPPADTGGSRNDAVTGSLLGYIPPDVAEQRYMERKAHKVLRTLELKGQVVRRVAPDGRTVLFPTDDPEALKHPRPARHHLRVQP